MIVNQLRAAAAHCGRWTAVNQLTRTNSGAFNMTLNIDLLINICSGLKKVLKTFSDTFSVSEVLIVISSRSADTDVRDSFPRVVFHPSNALETTFTNLP